MPQRDNIHDALAVERFRRRRRIDPDRVRRMQHALYHAHEPLRDALQRLGEVHVGPIMEQIDVQPLVECGRHASSLDQSTKLLLSAADGTRFETVVLRAPRGRMTVCVSTQAGCQAGCPFCATARMQWQRNLTAAELVEQVLLAGRLAQQRQRRIRNVVFMGMGEPLDNETELHAALRMLLDPRLCRFPPRRLMVSTVGVPAAMRRLVDQFPGVQLALSLHSARPDLRARLVPWSRRHGWDELRETLRYVADRHATHRHQGPVMIEHIMIDGVNDADEDADALIDYLQGMRAHVNLIPFNPVGHVDDWQATPRAQRDRFAGRLRQAGLFTTIRYSMGADIAAGCGQLAGAGSS